MKLGLAENTQSPAPAILVFGGGAVAKQIQQSIQGMGLKCLLWSDLDLPKDFIFPTRGDPSAREKIDHILRVFKNLGRDHAYVHPGVTHWAERPELESWARSAEMVLVSSPAKLLNLFQHTLSLIKTAETVGVPTLLLSDDVLTSAREIGVALKDIIEQKKGQFPFVLKSVDRVWNGLGVRNISGFDELKEWVPTWIEQLEEQNHNDMVFIERFVEGARSLIVPFARLKSGYTEFFNIVDASLQTQGKNWVEVCPAQHLEVEIEAKLRDYSKRVLDSVGFIGVGCLVFLYDGRECYLIEGLARLNLGYRLWERVAGTNAVQWQLATLAPALVTAPINGTRPIQRNTEVCGLNLKIYAEDVMLKVPHPGHVVELNHPPLEQGHFEAIWDVDPGQQVVPSSSGSIGQITVFERDWDSVLAKAKEIFSQVWVAGGVQTNERFLQELLSHPWVRESMVYTGFADEEFVPRMTPEPWMIEALAVALNELARLDDDESWMWLNTRLPRVEDTAHLNWKQRIDFVSPEKVFGVRGLFYRQARTQSGENTGEIRTERVHVYPISRDRYVIRLGAWFFSVRKTHRKQTLALYAQTQGRLYSLSIKEGMKIPARTPMAMIEAFGALVIHRLPIDVVVKQVHAQAESLVKVGQVLATLERIQDT